MKQQVSDTNKFKEYVLSPPSSLPRLPKCWTIYKVDGCVHTPMVYLRKPRGVGQEEFDMFMRWVKIYIG